MEYRASVKATVVHAILFALPALIVLLAAGRMSGGVIIMLLLVLIPIVRRRTFRLSVDGEKVQQVRSFLGRNVTTIEANRVEGVETQEGPLGRALGYGNIIISGTGGKKIKTVSVDSPASVASKIRAINPRTNDAANAPSTPSASLGAAPQTLDASLSNLARLRDEGVLSEAEFAEAKAKLLAQ